MFVLSWIDVCGVLKSCSATDSQQLVPDDYFCNLSSSIVRHTQGVKYEERSLPYAHVLSQESQRGLWHMNRTTIEGGSQKEQAAP
jgi:hypothetical protein